MGGRIRPFSARHSGVAGTNSPAVVWGLSVKKCFQIAALGAGFVLAAGLATSASAATPVNYAAAFTISYANSSGLQIATQSDQGGTNSTSGSVNFSLTGSTGPGNSTTMNLFDIWTPETEFDFPDVSAQPISVAFNFTAPSAHTGTVTGETGIFFQGFFNPIGQVTWSTTPTTINFGGETLSVALGNATFNFATQDECEHDHEDCSVTPDVADVTATFTQTITAGVPEPASWALMISGFGMTGAMLRRRRSALAA